MSHCKKENRGKAKLQKTSKKYCDVCGRKCRGINHDNGTFHKQKLDEITEPE